jgi:hypothetical protein
MSNITKVALLGASTLQNIRLEGMCPIVKNAIVYFAPVKRQTDTQRHRGIKAHRQIDK